jgi:hypothetical protein
MNYHNRHIEHEIKDCFGFSKAILASPQRGAMFETFVGNEIRKSLFRFAGSVGHYLFRA